MQQILLDRKYGVMIRVRDLDVRYPPAGCCRQISSHVHRDHLISTAVDDGYLQLRVSRKDLPQAGPIIEIVAKQVTERRPDAPLRHVAQTGERGDQDHPLHGVMCRKVQRGGCSERVPENGQLRIEVRLPDPEPLDKGTNSVAG